MSTRQAGIGGRLKVWLATVHSARPLAYIPGCT